MNRTLKQKIEQIIGPITYVIILDEQGCTSEVSRIETNNGSFILKSANEERYREWLRVEAKVLEEKGQEQDIPIPKYFGFIEEEGTSHLLMSYEPGKSLTTAISKAESTSERLLLIRSFGQFLNRFHEKHKSETIDYEEDWLTRQLSVAKKYVENGTADGTPQLLRRLEQNKPFPVQQTLIHGDCTTDNVLVFEGEVRMFIDVSGMTIGDPRYDETLAIGDFHNESEYMKAFYKGYTCYRVSKEEIEYFENLYEFF